MLTPIAAAVLALALPAAVWAAPAGSLISGRYEAVSNDCAPFSFIPGTTDILVQAEARGLRLGQIFYTGDGGPDSKPYFQAAFVFHTGTERVNCMGDCYSQYVSGYSGDGLEFRAVRNFASTMSAEPVYAGETDFRVHDGVLEVTTTDNGQPQPAPAATCVLKPMQAD